MRSFIIGRTNRHERKHVRRTSLVRRVMTAAERVSTYSGGYSARVCELVFGVCRVCSGGMEGPGGQSGG